MKDQVIISGITAGVSLNAETNTEEHFISVSLTSPIDARRRDTGEIRPTNYHSMNLLGFKNLIAANDYLAAIDIESDIRDNPELPLEEVYVSRYAKYLRGAKLTIEREGVYEDELDENEEPVLDENGEVKKKLVKFGNTMYEEVIITPLMQKKIELELGF